MNKILLNVSFNKFFDKLKFIYPLIDFSKFTKFDSVEKIIGNKHDCLIIDQTYLNDFDLMDNLLAELNNKTNLNGYIIIKYKRQPVVSLKKTKSLFHFVFKRALPKIPIFNIPYNYLYNRNNKSLSKTEAWGRLIFSGFDVFYEDKIDGIEDEYYLLCKKISLPITKQKPSFYPVIKLNRVGFKGEIFKLFKLRTMYPYSEFLQKKVFELNNLSETGKFQNDFRITEYGKFIRKFWLDELPQVINLLKHDIKLVGIRAMSEHYFSLYPEEYKILYKKVRPGFLSPLYENTTFECIVETEKKYLEEYLEHPLKTDIKYFFKITKDILSGKRST